MNIIEDIKNKKELKSLPDGFVKNLFDSYLREHRDVILDNPKSKDYRLAVKEVRKVLREVYGVFKVEKFGKREKLLDELKGLKDLEGHDKILALHRSTQERLDFYPNLYEKIFAVTGKPKSILDLGCGMNPLSLPYMELKDVKYIASELTSEDVDFLKRYFKKVGVEGEAFEMDLTKAEKMPSVDVCFMFKLLDTLETLKKDISRELVENVKCKWLVVSFPTKTIGGRKQISKNRLGWFEKIIKGRRFEVIEIENELFYIIKK
jgi:16S rRNA (guanine(1405)-N(7))-methyltransferase